jgi:hypothetical protein
MRPGVFALQWFFAKADDVSFPPAARDASFFFAERRLCWGGLPWRLSLCDVAPRWWRCAIGQGCAAPWHVVGARSCIGAWCMHRVAGSPERPERTCGHRRSVPHLQPDWAYPCHFCTISTASARA